MFPESGMCYYYMATSPGSSVCKCVDSEWPPSTAKSTAGSSVLSVLWSPNLSEWCWKWKIPPPPWGKHQPTRGHGAFNQKSISPLHRVKEYPGECLSVSNKKLFHNACRKGIGLKSSVVINHIKPTKHKLGKEQLVIKKEATERDNFMERMCHFKRIIRNYL